MENLQELERAYKELGDKIEELKNPPVKKSIYTLKSGADYYYIDEYGSIIEDEWYNTNADKELLLSGNITLTKEEAEKEVVKRKAIAKINKELHQLIHVSKYDNRDNDLEYIFVLDDYGNIQDRAREERHITPFNYKICTSLIATMIISRCYNELITLLQD
jgi:aspartyl aminopeptidase